MIFGAGAVGVEEEAGGMRGWENRVVGENEVENGRKNVEEEQEQWLADFGVGREQQWRADLEGSIGGGVRRLSLDVISRTPDAECGWNGAEGSRSWGNEG